MAKKKTVEQRSGWRLSARKSLPPPSSMKGKVLENGHAWLEMTSANNCKLDPLLPRRWETVADYERRTGFSLPMFDQRDILSLMLFACIINHRATQ